MQRGILGGTFDPIHIAHLIAGEGAYRQLHLDVVTFVPAGSPWQKASTSITPAEHRLEMARIATEGIDYFDVDDREVHRPGSTYTADTLASFPEGEKLALILGADAASRFATWHEPAAVEARAQIVVIPRPGTDRSAVEEAVAAELVWLDLPQLEISGSDLRRRVANGQSIRFLVPAGVHSYITRHGLYAP